MKARADRLYNDVAYVSDALPQTHPDRMATIGRLLGLNPAGVEQCRVLELGCGTGGNLLPMALSLPSSSFVGVDVAEKSIRRGRQQMRRIGFENVEMHVADILELDDSLGTFDYIVAHGVYSWVSAPVREKLLALCRELLAPHGIAYVSYNVLPGWNLERSSREMMRYHMAQYEDHDRQMREARGLLAMLADAQTSPSPYADLLAREKERLESYPDWFLSHDHLAEINEPLYFHEFVEEASEHQLQFLAEADFHSMFPRGLAPWAADVLDQADDVEMREQYLDFFLGRRFRRTLLCHASRSLTREPGPEAVRRFLVSSPVREVERGNTTVRYTGYDGRAVETSHPLAHAALHELKDSWPRRVGFEELSRDVAARRGHAEKGAEDLLASLLLGLYEDGVVQLHTFMPSLVTHVTEHPVASPLARDQVQHDTLVTTLLHESVPVEDAAMGHLLPLLDGTRTIDEVTNELSAVVRVDREQVERALHYLACSGLLLA